MVAKKFIHSDEEWEEIQEELYQAEEWRIVMVNPSLVEWEAGD